MGGAAAVGLGVGGMLPGRMIAAAQNATAETGDGLYAYPEWTSSGKRVFEDPPPSIVDDQGRLRLGFFKTPCRNVNLADAALFGEGKKRKKNMTQLKEHIGYGVVHPEAQFSFIIMDTQVLGASGLYSYNFAQDKFFEHKAAVFDQESYRLADTTWNDHSFIRSGAYSLEFDHQLDKGYHQIKIEIGATSNAPAVSADIKFLEDLSEIQPFVVCMPVSTNHFMYTQKVHMPVEGVIKVDSKEYVLDPARDKAGMDEHKGYYPFEIHYCWAAFGGFDSRRRFLGANFNENKDFMAPDIWSENCMWVGKDISLMAGVHFEYDPADVGKPWHITEKNGRMELDFYPDARKEEKHNLLVARINYYQQCGNFRGFVIDDSGVKHDVDNIYGVCEEFISEI